jgi:hypothetical protein
MLATTVRRRKRSAAAGRKIQYGRAAIEFTPGSLERDLSNIGGSVPAEEWAAIPADYFSDLDQHVHGAPRKK